MSTKSGQLGCGSPFPWVRDCAGVPGRDSSGHHNLAFQSKVLALLIISSKTGQLPSTWLRLGTLTSPLLVTCSLGNHKRQDSLLGGQCGCGAQQHLSVPAGSVPLDPELSRSLEEGRDFIQEFPRSPAFPALTSIAQEILNATPALLS